MKTSLLICLLLISTGALGFAQGPTPGFIQFGNNFVSSSFRSLIYGPDPMNPTLVQVGQSTNALEVPIGTAVYNGPLLSGTGYTFAFFAGPAGSVSNILTLCGSTGFRTGAAAGLVPFLQAVTVPGTFAGEHATFQIRVWNNQNGTLNTWAAAEQAWLSGQTDAAVTPLILSDVLGGTDSNQDPLVNPVTSGWASFNTYYVAPEPASFTLAALGAAALLVFRRVRD